MSILPIEHIADWEQRIARQDAFWQCEIIDRPVVLMTLPHPQPDYPWPAAGNWATPRDRWMDVEHMAACALAGAMGTEYLGDALPTVWPNLGPEFFSTCFGCELEFSDSTSWSIPILHDWADVGQLAFSTDNPYWHKMVAMTEALLDVGQGKFYTGLTDFHPGGDLVASLRDPLNFNYDMIDAVEETRALLATVTERYLAVFDYFHDKLAAAGQACTTWAGIVSSKKWYVPSNDFSCMVSKAMFDDLFLPGIAAECRHMEASIYHLDGPNALQHLDSLLAIPELNAIQWVYGSGHGRSTDWLPVYQRCQAAGKGVQVNIELDELPTLMEAIHPEGVWLGIWGVPDRATADAVLKSVAAWR